MKNLILRTATLLFISFDMCGIVHADDHFKKYINMLNNSPTVWETWTIVDNSRFCYRDYNVVYKDGEVITGTPVLPFIAANDNSAMLKRAVRVIQRECF